jgi:hypothetical protein
VLVAAALAALGSRRRSLLEGGGLLARRGDRRSRIQDAAVSAENSLYPPPDTGRFEEPPGTVYATSSVEDLPSGEGMEARVERKESGSEFPLLFGRGAGLEALDEQEDQLRKGPNGAIAS